MHEQDTEQLDGIEPIAIVGLAARLPGAADADEYWANLIAGRESVRRFTPEDLVAAGEDPDVAADPRYVPAAGALGGYDRFDARFFELSRREALVLDPQHRLFLECSWHALEDACWDPAAFDGRVGVFGGTGMNAYFWMNLREGFDGPLEGLEARLSNDRDFLTTLVSYKLDLTGPSIGVQTACSTSLVAVHAACQSLLSHECDMALAGGVTILLPQGVGYVHREAGTMSADGHCRPFDAEATGLVEGSGAGVVCLRRLSDALEDGDPVRAVIMGSAVTNDGARKVGYTAPSVEGQATAIREALEVAGLDGEAIRFVEAHGTGTRVGDPIEVEALSRAFATRRTGYCALGSVKANIGHCDAAAGVASLIKAVLALEHGVLPPNPNFRSPNPLVDFPATPFYVNAEPVELNGGEPVYAGVSSFGMGGTNAHVVIGEAPAAATKPATPAGGPALLCVSARSGAAASRAAGELAARLDAGDLALHDAAYTTQTGRRAFPWRATVVAQDARAAASALRALEPPARPAAETPHPVFLFPGQGSQRVGMAAGLAAAQPAFRETLDRCCAALPRELGERLRALLVDAGAHPEDPALQPTELAQPALFVVEYALAELFLRWGVEPRSMVGHSIGEYVAATLAGVFALDDALAVVAERGRLMASVDPGAMVAVAAPPGEIEDLLRANDVDLAAVNAPRQVVASGTADGIAALGERLAERGIKHTSLRTSNAFHSPLMDPILDDFRAVVAGVALAAPRRRLFSNVTGAPLTAEQATSPAYWADQLRRPVNLSVALAAAAAEPGAALVELGPGRTLSRLALQHAAGRDVTAVAALPCDEGAADTVLGALAALWEAGVQPRWNALHEATAPRRVRLPLYPFERERYWVDAPAARAAAAAPQASAPPEAPEPAGGLAATEPVDDGAAADAPTSVEQTVAAVFAAAFGLPAVEPTDDFFELGGNSLVAIDVLDRLSRELAVEVGLQALYDAPRVRDLAAVLAPREDGDDLDALTAELAQLSPEVLEQLMGELPEPATQRPEERT